MGMSGHTFDDRTAALRAAGLPFAIATVVRTVNATSAKPGAKAIITEMARSPRAGSAAAASALPSAKPRKQR